MTDAALRRDSTDRLVLSDGTATTLHISRWSLATTTVRVVRFDPRAQLEAWCSNGGSPDALVGGFYIRRSGMPLGELWIGGERQPSVPFAAPWHDRRGCLHIDGDLRIDERAGFGAAVAGDLLQAGPLLLHRGVVRCRDGEDDEGFSAAAHQFDSDITSGRHPRTAIGVGGGDVIAATCEGRSDDEAGLTLGELADAMAAAGADCALNLDGGGSTSLVCDGRLRNTPRESHNVSVPGGRELATAIVFEPA